LALFAARLFPGHGAAVLVSGRSPLSEPATLVGLAAAAVSPYDRRAEHHPVGAADVLQPPVVSLLRGGPAAGRSVGTGRPGGGRRPDVGAGVGGLSVAALLDRHPAPLRPR